MPADSIRKRTPGIIRGHLHSPLSNSALSVLFSYYWLTIQRSPSIFLFVATHIIEDVLDFHIFMVPNAQRWMRETGAAPLGGRR